MALNDDDPAALSIALTEIYTRDPGIVKRHFDTNEPAGLQLLIEIWKLSDKYQLPNLTLQCLALINTDVGTELLKKRSGIQWTKDLLEGLIETKGLQPDKDDAKHNLAMRTHLKKLLLESKNMDEMTAEEEAILNSDAEVAAELFKYAAGQVSHEIVDAVSINTTAPKTRPRHKLNVST